MKVAFTTSGDNLSAPLEQRFGRAPNFLVYDLDSGTFEVADNLQTQIRQLVGLSRVQQRFVSDVSHELRTPLTTVRMAAEVLHDGKDSFDVLEQRSVELLQHELDRFESLLGDLLEISRFDAGAAAHERAFVCRHR